MVLAFLVSRNSLAMTWSSPSCSVDRTMPSPDLPRYFWPALPPAPSRPSAALHRTFRCLSCTEPPHHAQAGASVPTSLSALPASGLLCSLLSLAFTRPALTASAAVSGSCKLSLIPRRTESVYCELQKCLVLSPCLPWSSPPPLYMCGCDYLVVNPFY